MKVIIAGSRTFNDYDFLKKNCLKIFKQLKSEGYDTKRETLEIISGTAKGADRLGEQFANEFNLKLIRFPADWDKLGRKAGYIRNERMALYAKKDNGVLIAFWDKSSKGTKHMIDLANKHGLRVFVVKFSFDLKVN